jgi:S-DNA-T family DNA segregation ATPase FtsK/SpoIIIE
MLVGGTSGSGKTTFLRSILVQLAHLSQQQLQTIIIDGKGEVDFIGLLPNSLFPPEFPEVVLGQDEVMNVLDWIVEYEVPRRKSQIVEMARQSSSPVSRTGARGRYTAFLSGTEPLLFPPLIVVIDEFAEIALSQRKSGFEERVRSIAQAGRSQLVHLILATQRPDARIVEGAIKSNLDTRVALRLPTSHDSMTILGGGGAEKLLGHGDLIFQNSSTPPKRLQGYSA